MEGARRGDVEIAGTKFGEQSRCEGRFFPAGLVPERWDMWPFLEALARHGWHMDKAIRFGRTRQSRAHQRHLVPKLRKLPGDIDEGDFGAAINFMETGEC